MDHGGKADRLDARIYSGIWNAGCRGCEVFDDSLLHQYVGVPGDAVHLSLPVHGFGPIAVWIGMFTDWTIRGIVFTFRFMGRRWLAHKVV